METCLELHFEIKIRSLSNLDLFFAGFLHCSWYFLEEMAKINQSKMKTEIHQLRIDVVKFDGPNNVGTWRCEMTDPLTTLNLEDALRFEKKLEEISEKD